MKRIILAVTIMMAILLVSCSGNSHDAGPTGSPEGRDQKLTKETSADYPFYNDVDSLAEKADNIIMGTVREVKNELISTMSSKEALINPEEASEIVMTSLYTIYTIQVEDVYKGDCKIGDTVEILQLGNGEDDEYIYISKDFVELKEDISYAIFFNAHGYLLNPQQTIYAMDGATQAMSRTSSQNTLTVNLDVLETIRETYE